MMTPARPSPRPKPRLPFVAFASILLATLGVGCQTGLGPHTATARYQIIDHFPDRPGAVEILGIEMRSALPEGSLSEAELKKLAGFVCHRLRQMTIGAIGNLNGGADPERMEVILTVDIERFDATTLEQRRNREPAYLFGKLSLWRVANERQLGRAKVWARGARLELDTNNISDTVAEFAGAIHKVVF